MEEVTVTYKTYTFDELPKDVQDKVCQSEPFRWINVDYDWWEFDCLTGWSSEEMKKYHFPKNSPDLLKYKRLYFNLDRAAYIQFQDAEFADDEIARKFLGVSKRLWDKTNFIINAIPHRESNTRLKYECGDYEKEFTEKEIEILDQAVERFADKVHEAWVMLRDQYEYLTSRDAIEDSIRANGYKFLENGKVFHG